jgi:ergothioneine biosynthesis protein EgtB
MRELLKTEISTEISKLIELGLYHEQQHQELILTDVKHLLSMNPLQPSYSEADLFGETSQAGPSAWQTLQGGLIEVGHSGGGFCFDNEKPRHRRFVEPFQIASSLVTNRDFLEFLKVGGYHDPLYWLSDGWDWISQNHITHPLYWHSTEGDWKEFTLQGLKELDLQRPVTHISYFEAEAFARWSEARLPTEFEWEHAASSVEMAEIFGTAWQWTASGYDPYPGFTTAEGVIGEYNGKFMVNQYVLRGASWATPLESFRKTYRNFFPATARWQITGIRLARSGVP